MSYVPGQLADTWANLVADSDIIYKTCYFFLHSHTTCVEGSSSGFPGCHKVNAYILFMSCTVLCAVKELPDGNSVFVKSDIGNKDIPILKEK